MNIKFLKNSEPNFSENLKGLLDFDSSNSEMIIETTHNILLAVKEKGDEALLEFSKKFDDLDFTNAAELEISEADINEAFERISLEQNERSMSLLREYLNTIRNKKWSHGPMRTMKVQCLAKKLHHLIELGFMYLEGKQLTHPRF